METPSSVSIGRSADNDIVIPLDAVSGHHARLEREGDKIVLVDLESTNGTAINNPLNKITRAAIEPSDIIFFGTHCVPAGDLWSRVRSGSGTQQTSTADQAPKVHRNVPGIPDDGSTPSRPKQKKRLSTHSDLQGQLLVGAVLCMLLLGGIFVGGWLIRRNDTTSNAQSQPLQIQIGKLEPEPDNKVNPQPKNGQVLPVVPAPVLPVLPAPVLPPAAVVPAIRDQERAMAIVCGVKRGSAQNNFLIPFTTAWAVDSHHLVTRALRLAQLGAGAGQNHAPRLVALTSAGAFEVQQVLYHPKFPRDKVGNPTPQDAAQMFFHDVALLKTRKELPWTMDLAPSGEFDSIPVPQGMPTRIISVRNIRGDLPANAVPEPAVLPSALQRPAGEQLPNPDFAELHAQITDIEADGTPVLNQQNRAIGLLLLEFNRAGVRPGPHHVLPVDRIHEMLIQK